MSLSNPLSWLIVAGASVAVVVVCSLWLLWPRKRRTDAHLLLGRPLLTGAIVGLGLVPAQVSLQLELRQHDQKIATEQQAQASRSELITSLNLRTDLRDIDLHDADLRKLYLAHRDFAGADFHSAHLNDADLAGANLRGTDLEDAQLQGANLEHANLDDGANLEDAQLQGADLDGANLDGALLGHADLRSTSLRGAALTGTHIEWARFEDADLTSAKFAPDGEFDSYASFRGALFANIEESNVRMSNDWFDNAAFYDDSFLAGSFAESSFVGAQFGDTLIVGGSLCGSRLVNTTFVDTSILGTALLRTDLESAVVSPDSVFAVADIRGANLTGFTIAGHIAREGNPLAVEMAPEASPLADRLRREGGPILRREPLTAQVSGYSGTVMFYRSAYDRNTRAGSVVRNHGGQRWTTASSELLNCNEDSTPVGRPLSAIPRVAHLATSPTTIIERVDGKENVPPEPELRALRGSLAIAYALMLPCLEWPRRDREGCWEIVHDVLPKTPRRIGAEATGEGRIIGQASATINSIQVAPPVVGTPPAPP
jgi:uncharacterized protein YjbI with pentapeptide repeats